MFPDVILIIQVSDVVDLCHYVVLLLTLAFLQLANVFFFFVKYLHNYLNLTVVGFSEGLKVTMFETNDSRPEKDANESPLVANNFPIFLNKHLHSDMQRNNSNGEMQNTYDVFPDRGVD